jgi:hypothetical protein
MAVLSLAATATLLMPVTSTTPCTVASSFPTRTEFCSSIHPSLVITLDAPRISTVGLIIIIPFLTDTHAVLAHINSTINEKNQTLTGGHVSHVGQLFFDQKLITEAESVEPYTSNTQELLLNADDGIFAQEAENSDPVLNYVYLGDSVEEGLFAWVTVGIDPTSVINPNAAASLGENGGVANPGSGGGFPGGPPPSGGFPGGPRPTSTGAPNSTVV